MQHLNCVANTEFHNKSKTNLLVFWPQVLIKKGNREIHLFTTDLNKEFILAHEV